MIYVQKENAENKFSSCCQLCGSAIMKTNCWDFLGQECCRLWKIAGQHVFGLKKRMKEKRRKTVQSQNLRSSSTPSE